MADKTQNVTVKRDGADVHYSVDASDKAAAKDVAAHAEARRADREAREATAAEANA